MNDFFYYSMIRSKTENTTKTRKLDGKVPVDEIKNLMRAMGYYPTKQEEKNMIDEVRFQNLAQKGEATTHIGLNEFIQLFVNHRPVYGIGQQNIEDAFEALLGGETGDFKTLKRDKLLEILQNEGEAITQKELTGILSMLTGKSDEHEALKHEIDAKYFAEEVLGFEEIEENEDGQEQE